MAVHAELPLITTEKVFPRPIFLLRGYKMENMTERKMYDVAVIGIGPAGLSALVYCSKPISMLLPSAPSWRPYKQTPEITNWPFIPALSGKAFQESMLSFFENLQSKFPEYLSMVKGAITSAAEAVGKMYKLTAQTSDGDMVFFTRAIIIATGATRKNLPVAGAKELQGKGIAFCGTCDAPFFKDDRVAVVGGGNTALENILTLTKYAREVMAVIVTDDFTGNPDLRARISKLPKVTIIRNTRYSKLSAARRSRNQTQGIEDRREWVEDVDGVFPSIGATSIPSRSPAL